MNFNKLIAIILFGLVSCTNSNPIESGYIVDMSYQPEYLTFMPCGKSTVPIFHKERCVIWIANRKAVRELEVSESEYEGLNKGQFFKIKK